MQFKKKEPLIILALVVVFELMLGVGQLVADEIRVAVARNFSNTIKSITQIFEMKTKVWLYLELVSLMQ